MQAPGMPRPLLPVPAPTSCSARLLPCLAALCRWAPAPASPWATTCGCLATSCTAWRSCTTWRSPLTPRCACWCLCLPAASTGGVAVCGMSGPCTCCVLTPWMPSVLPTPRAAHPRRLERRGRPHQLLFQVHPPGRDWLAGDPGPGAWRGAANEWLLHCSPAAFACCPWPCHSSMCVPACSLAQASMLMAPDPPARPWCNLPNQQIAKLERRHAVHIAAYGEGNERRLTGARAASVGMSRQLRCMHCMCETAQARQLAPLPGCTGDAIRLLARPALQASTRRAASTTSAGAWPTAAAPSAWAAWCPWRSAVSGETGHWVGGCC